MKIGVITISQGTNYGNRLQIYAVQKVLEDMGHQSYLVENNTNAHGAVYELKKLIKIAIGYKDARAEFGRAKAFGRFDRNYIRIAPAGFDERYQSQTVGEEYDALLCGSDQVWNPYSPFLNGGCFGCLPGAKKRISYAASFGVSAVPEEKKEQVRQWLSGMDAISVREESAVGIVRELTGASAQVLIDPTMMLSAEDWEQIEEAPGNMPQSKYIFRYFLGQTKPEVAQFIDRLANENDLEVVDVLPDKSHPDYRLSPANFVYLLHHAQCVVTDSFHAAVFAFLFRKNLRLFDRVDARLDMSTRLDTLLGLFDASGLRNNHDTELQSDAMPDPDKVLSTERERALTFLNNALGR